MIPQTQDNNSLTTDLAAVVGADYVLSDPDSCSLYAQDVFTKALPKTETGKIQRFKLRD